MNYEFKKGSYIKADANAAGAMCEQLEKTVGLTPKNFLDANRAEDAPLHGCFEWNDGAAAELYREQQARHIINCLCIKSEEPKAEPIRAFFNIEKTVYESTVAIIRHEDKRAALLNQALRELQAFERKYNTLCELEPIFEAAKNIKSA